MEILMYETPVIEGNYIRDMGYKIDKTGSLYFHSKDRDSVDLWFRENLKPEHWTMIIGGQANPHSPIVDSFGKPFDYVISLHRHFKDKGTEGKLGKYTSKSIKI